MRSSPVGIGFELSYSYRIEMVQPGGSFSSSLILKSALCRAPRGLFVRGRHVALPVLVLVLLVAAAGPCMGQVSAGDRSQEYNVKSAYLYSFGRFVTWPPEAFRRAAAEFEIGIFGENSFGDRLERIAAKKQIQGRPIVIRHFRSLDECTACHILFVSGLADPEIQSAVIRKFRDAPVLLVGESPGFAEAGGTANFFISGDTVRFEINVEATKRQQLTMDAKLLSLAKTVRDSPEQQ